MTGREHLVGDGNGGMWNPPSDSGWLKNDDSGEAGFSEATGEL